MYFIADIAANHDGSLDRALHLISLAKAAGADAAKFQNFRAERIVSRYGFESLGGQVGHQAKWKESVFDVYQAATVPWSWTPTLKEYCAKVGIDYLSTPYDLDAVDMLDPHVEAFKIGSGDITWPEMLEKVASKGKPVLLATGASDLHDVHRAAKTLLQAGTQLALLQCNTNYTGATENYKYVHLRVLQTYRQTFPDVLLGLSDHTPGHTAVLGAVALGASIIEKHFTDDTTRAGPDHAFAMTPTTWKEMVDRGRELQWALGSGEKKIEANETDTIIVQRRCLRAVRAIPAGARLSREMLVSLRPAPKGSLAPYAIEQVLGHRLRVRLREGEHLTLAHIA